MPERIRLDVSARPASLGTVRRVLGGLGARLGYSLDDLDDLYLGTEEILRCALANEAPERLRFDVLVGPDQLDLTVGPFTSATLRAAVTAPLPAHDSVDLHRLLQRTMDEVRVTAHHASDYDIVLIRRHRGAA